MQNIDAPDLHHAGKSIHLHFAHRGADREIVKRFSLARFAIEMDVAAFDKNRSRSDLSARNRRAGITRRKESADRRIVTFSTMLSVKTILSAPARRTAFFGQHFDGEWKQSSAQNFAGVFHGRAIKSVPQDAAVADVFGTLSVRVVITRTRSKSYAQFVARRSCAMLVCTPGPSRCRHG